MTGMGTPRSTAPRGAALLVCLVLAAGFWGCAAAPPREAERAPRPRPAPYVAPPPPAVASAPRPPAAPPPPAPEPAPSRPVRVLLGGAANEVLIEGSVLRAWDAAGQAVADESNAVVLSAVGEKIRWNARTLLPSPIDVGSPGGLRTSGKRLPGRVRITARAGRLFAVAPVPLEDYVAAVASREAPPGFEPEALAALTVAVRTYALQAIEKNREPMYDVVSGVEDQVFEGMDNVTGVFRSATQETRGIVLTYGGALARAVFHSTCGGRTETAKDAWGTDMPYLRSVACDDCRDSPVYRWSFRMSKKEGKRVALALGVRPSDDLRIEIVRRSSTGRASRVRLSSGGVSRETSAASFRKAAGYARVRSLKMEIVPVGGNGWSIAGQGYGHGVGMCQWGSNGMAKAGKGYREILARYYPGTRLAEIRP